MHAAIGAVVSPMVLFFLLGLAAAWVRSDLEVPAPLGSLFSLYLMLAIGFKGGSELAAAPGSGAVLAALFVGVLLSFLMPLLAFALLRAVSSLDRINAATVAAHYGSVSAVTFVTAVGFLNQHAVKYEGYLVAMLAVMEVPAIITGVLLARRATSAAGSGISASLLRHALTSGSVVLLTGSFAIGWVTGVEGRATLRPFVDDLFFGVLCLFLLDMGLLAARRMQEFGRVGGRLILFAVLMLPLGAGVGLVAGLSLGLSTGGVVLVMVLAASASYIAVPAAMRLAIPEADPAVSVTLSLGVTFPINVMIGIPVYFEIARRVVG